MSKPAHGDKSPGWGAGAPGQVFYDLAWLGRRRPIP
jgi:hypothetical protein